jgi:GT2 family glycosyltransferase
MTAVDVSVVLVNYNTREVLERTLAAVLADANAIAMEVIVVDNASADGSAAMVRDRFPSVRLIVNDTNRYYSAANNQGMRSSSGRHVLILNPDAEPRPGTLAAMVACMDEQPDIGALSVPMYFPGGVLQRNCARDPTRAVLLLDYTPVGLLLGPLRRRTLDRHWYGDWDRTNARDVDVLPGSCLMVRREALQRVGGFDERLLMYFAEDDWCRRIRQAGYRAAYRPVGGVVHPEGTSVRQVARHARRLYFADLVRYARTRHGGASAAILWVTTRPTLWALEMASVWRGR